MKRGTRISRPDSSLTVLVTLPEGAARTRLGVSHLQLNLQWQLQADRIAVELMQLDHGAFHQKVQGVANHLFVEGERLGGLLIEEVRSSFVAVEVGRGTDLQVGLFEFVAGLEGFSKTALVRRLRTLRRTRVRPPRAVGVFTSGFQTVVRVFSNSKNILRLILMASIKAAMKSSRAGSAKKISSKPDL